MTDSDYTVVAGICRERPIGKTELDGDRIIGVAPEKECRVDMTHPQPAAPPAPRRKHPVTKDGGDRKSAKSDRQNDEADRTVDVWHSWRQCPPPPDLVAEIEEIARHRQCRPRKVLWWLVREALRQRSGRQ
jgi:hypothetical protein